MIKKGALLLALICFQLTFAQDYEFGEVSKQELQEKVYEKDTSANAAVLYKHQQTYFDYYPGGIQVITEVQERIKIYNKEGFEYATQTINLFKSRSSKESIGKIKAYTYNLKGDQIEKTQLDKHQIFENEYSYNTNQVKFTMPKVQEGSVIEFKYKTTSPYIYSLDEVVLQYPIPIKKIIVELRTPEALEFNTIQKGYIPCRPQVSSKRNITLDTRDIVNTFKLEDVPALKEEKYVDNLKNYRAGFMIELTGINIPGEYTKSFSQTWQEVANYIGSSDDYDRQLERTGLFKDEVDQVTASAITISDKMQAIFNYVKDQIKWNGIGGMYFQKGIKKALKEHEGNAADINLTLVSMLRYAGIDANPVVISTKDNGTPLFPTIDRLNHVVAYAKIDDKPYFLDATEEFDGINLMPVKNYNWRGVYIDNQESVWQLIDLASAPKSHGQHMLNATLNEDGTMEGSLNSKYINHYAMEFRRKFKDQDKESFISKREANFNNIEISNYNVENADTAEGNLIESFDFYKEDGSELIGQDLYISPLLFFKTEENPFKAEERKYPIDFGYTHKDQYLIKVTIPEGYTLDTPITPVIVKTPNDSAEFKFSGRLMKNTLQILCSVDIKKVVVPQQNYLYLKEFFNQLVSKSSEKILLKKL